jgi:hypothetical protein
LGDGGVNCGHEADCFAPGRDHLLVVGQVLLAQSAASAVFEPFFANLMAADVEIPDFGRNAFEVLAFL